jgi:hypothetical protein
MPMLALGSLMPMPSYAIYVYDPCGNVCYFETSKSSKKKGGSKSFPGSAVSGGHIPESLDPKMRFSWDNSHPREYFLATFHGATQFYIFRGNSAVRR